MRPQGEISAAIFAAAQTKGSATLQELAHAARVSVHDARHTVNNMRRSGALVPVGERRVSYRNRPVKVYAPKAADTSATRQPLADEVDLSAILRIWN